MSARESHSHMVLLEQAPFFEGFSSEELHRIAELSDAVDLPAASVVIDQGDLGRHCFVIVEGSAGVYVRGEYITSVGPGSMVGEMSLVEQRPRTATVVAETDLSLLRFDAQAFSTLLAEMPRAHERVMSMLKARLTTPPTGQ